MKTAFFRCVKVVHEEKQTYGYEKDPTRETTVSVQFELVGDTDTFGYAHLTLTNEQFKEAGYEVAKVYSLNPT